MFPKKKDIPPKPKKWKEMVEIAEKIVTFCGSHRPILNGGSRRLLFSVTKGAQLSPKLETEG